MVELSREQYRRKVLGCWRGKCAGGTLGQPFEGRPGPLNLSFYHELPRGAAPNDDLDLQVVFAEVLRRVGTAFSRLDLAQAWLRQVEFPFDEYGIALCNLKRGLRPPISGAYDNWFTDCMGAPIRSEIWACLAPGDPALAAQLAYEDAVVDHSGEGLFGEIFLAALQSAAFVLSDRDALLDLALEAVPAECRVARAVRLVRESFARGLSWEENRRALLEAFGHPNFTDAPQNLAIIVLGWLYGGDDFGAALCAAVNAGKDTDCTGATLGALLGIIMDERLPRRWLEPLGDELVVSPGLKYLHYDPTIQQFTDTVCRLGEEFLAAKSTSVRLTDAPPPTTVQRLDVNWAPVRELLARPRNTSLLYTAGPRVWAEYPEGPVLCYGEELTVRLYISGPPAVAPGDVSVVAPRGWEMRHSARATGRELEIELVLSAGPGAPIFPTNPVRYALRCGGATIAGELAVLGPYCWERGEFIACTREQFASLPFPSAGAWELVQERERDVALEKLAPRGTAGALPLRTRIYFPQLEQNVRFVFACDSPVRAWLAGEPLLSCLDDGPQMPAVHRPRKGTAADKPLRRGWYELWLLIFCPRDRVPRFRLSLGDAHSRHLLPDADLSSWVARRGG